MNLLLTGAWADAQVYVPKLEAMGHAVKLLQQESDPLPCTYDWVEGVVCNGLFTSHPMEKFVNLRYIQLTSAGFDRLDPDAVERRGIKVRNARSVYSIPMAEYALAGVLALYGRMGDFAEKQRDHRWEKCREIPELWGKNVLIVGCGDVGTACARRFRAFGCSVVGVNRTVKTLPDFDRVVDFARMDSCLAQADVVVLCVALAEETRHLLDARRLSLLKSSAVLVNIARGALVDEKALGEVLPRMGGAVLDVFEQEPLPADSPLWNMKNVVITPHNSFVGEGNGQRLAHVILEGLA